MAETEKQTVNHTYRVAVKFTSIVTKQVFIRATNYADAEEHAENLSTSFFDDDEPEEEIEIEEIAKVDDDEEYDRITKAAEDAEPIEDEDEEDDEA